MPPRQQRSLQQHSSSSVAADLFPIYRPPAAGPSSATTAAFQSRHRSPSPDHPGRLERFIIKAHEADLVTGQPEIAHQLEQKRGAGESKQGRLVQCASSLSTGADDSDENAGVWVDRFSHLHLLSVVPVTSLAASRPASPFSDWSSLPSDAEDTFFFSDDEGDEYERHKKRRRLEELRTRRMEQLQPVDEPEPAEEQGDLWGGDDEEPTDAVHTLMKHTSASLKGSPNPALLTMRILANHGADRRFDFLKGRYAKAWQEVQNPPPKVDAIGSLLGGYESSESSGDDDDDDEAGQEADSSAARPDETQDIASVAIEDTSTATEEQEAEKRRLRREKARLWSEKRKTGVDGTPP